MGPVAPLLAIYEIYKKHNPQAEFIWVGTKNGPEKGLVESYKIPFFAITSGKLRQYFSWDNFLDIFKISFGFWQSLFLLKREKPDMLITAGGFVSVPLHFAAFVLKIPTWVHQQDLAVGLANKLMSCTATKITTALAENKQYFLSKQIEWIGNPARNLTVTDKNNSRKKFNIPEGSPVILAMGGGTGSIKINKLIVETLSIWPKNFHIIHLTGKERSVELSEAATNDFPNYHAFQFLKEDIKDAYASADVVIARAGFSTITELAALSKAAILIPIADTHQEVNAKFLSDRQAAIVLDERKINDLDLAETVVGIINSVEKKKHLEEKLHTVLPAASAQKVIEIIEEIVMQR